MKLFAAVLAFALSALAAPPIDKDKAIGNPTAPVTIEIASDFNCPACKAFHEQTLPLLIRDFVAQGKIYIVPREFPLITLAQHRYSRDAAIAATAAGRVGKYAAASDLLFQNQDATATNPKSWAVNGRVFDVIAPALSAEQRKKVQALMKDPAIIAEVQADLNYAQASGLNETPTLILYRGPKRMPLSGGVLKYALLKQLIQDTINGK